MPVIKMTKLPQNTQKNQNKILQSIPAKYFTVKQILLVEMIMCVLLPIAVVKLSKLKPKIQITAG